jgi:hypothetical protein
VSASHGKLDTIDAFLHQMMADAPVPDTGSAAEDFRLTLRGMMRFYTSRCGAVSSERSSSSASATAIDGSGPPRGGGSNL